MGIGLLDILESCQVGTEVPNDFALFGGLGFKSLDVQSLSSDLLAEGILALSAAGQISS
ncbi:hypothetical protein [Arthrobacter oryzae]|uniref:hypothetical protein n=1 Tax=Arthrobacter oryzae TaxID=409290 RepID=UPI00285C2FF7|nr:hypothetical protein [Arthrobacter oryzae]MDR6507720.1 hypothetical protein [Arthrobacter oryzae]